MKHLKIRTKMILGFGFILLLLIVMNGFSLLNMRRISNQAPDLYQGPHMMEVSALALAKELYQMDSAAKGALLAEDAGALDQKFEQARQAAAVDVKALSGFAQHASAAAELNQALSDAAASYQKITQLARTGAKEDARAELSRNFTPVIERAVQSALNLTQTADQEARELLERALEQTNRTAAVQDVLFLVIVICAIFTALKMSADITRPVEVLAGKMSQISKGDFDVRMENTNRDEIGRLSCQLGDMIGRIKDYIYDITYTLGEMSKGNISLEVSRDYIGDFDAIKRSLNQIIESMNGMVIGIRECGSQVNQGARNLSANASMLSGGAEEQAAAMEEFAQHLKRVAMLTREDAQNAVHIKEISEKAIEAVNQSDSQMTRMTEAMSRIEHSSGEIAKVIKMIEDIAFQTNILALNAAVEAARAGQAGKGFAVVADEVRNLASRSGEAAGSTTALISKAVEAVKDGITINQATASCLGEVSANVHSMSDLLGNIDASTSEQAAAFSKMEESLENINHTVRENTLAAEENSAASNQLSLQADALSGIIQRFRTKNG